MSNYIPIGPSTFAPAKGGIASLFQGGVLGRAGGVPIGNQSLVSQLAPRLTPSMRVPTNPFGQGFGLPGAQGLGAQASRAGAAAFNPASAGLNFVDDAAAAAAGTAGRTGLLSRLPGLPAGGLSWTKPGLGTTASSIAAPLISTAAGGMIFGESDENKLLEAGRGFTRGVGYAAPVSAALTASGIGAPAAPVVMGVTGTIGAALDVLDASDWFGGGKDDDKPKPLDILGDAINRANLSPEYEEAILQAFDVQLAFAEGLEGQEKEDAERAAFEQAAAMVDQAFQMQVTERLENVGGGGMGMGGGGGQQNLLALQQQAAQVFEPIAQNVETNAKLYQQAMEHNRQYLPESFKAFADQQMMQTQSSSSNLANAYRAQAAIMPQVNAIQQYQQEQEAIKNQLFQQYQSAAMSAMGQGGTSGLFGGGAATTDIAAMLTPQG